MSDKKVINIFKLIFSFVFLVFLNACSSNDKTEENITTTKIPAPLQKLATGSGQLTAYVQLDGADIRILMDINPEGDGSASVILPGLSRTVHNVLITYEYTDDVGSLLLAQANVQADLTSGSFDLNVQLEDYTLAFDEDRDGITNTKELLNGTDPRDDGLSNTVIVRMVIESTIPKLTQADISGGSLRAYATLDGNIQNRIEMTLDIIAGQANFTITNLQNRLYSLLVTFEYTDVNGTFVVAENNQNVDLTFGGVLVNIDANQFDFISYDEDNDGTYNIDEIIRNSNPNVANIPIASVLNLAYEGVKTFRFSWQDAGGEQVFYQLLENADGASGFTQVGADIPAKTELLAHVVALYNRQNAQYILRTCNQLGCSDSVRMDINSSVINSVGYFKIDRTVEFRTVVGFSGDGGTLVMKRFDGDATVFTNASGGWREQALILNPRPFLRAPETIGSIGEVSLSSDGSTLAMFVDDDRTGRGIDSTVATTVSGRSGYYGSVYVFRLNGNTWEQQAYIKASNHDLGDNFGLSISLSDNGNTLAVGSSGEDSDALGTAANIDQLNSAANNSGAVYVFTRNDAGVWRQHSYIKASNTDVGDFFSRVSLSGDGLTLAVGATGEDSSQTGTISGNGLQMPVNNDVIDSGAVYVFKLDVQADVWIQDAYIKASNVDVSDHFGQQISLSRNGNTMVVTAIDEDGVDRNNLNDNSSLSFGAVYVFERSVNGWLQQDYLKPEVIHSSPAFGSSVSLSSNGQLLAIGSPGEESDAIGINGDQSDKNFASGAAYLFVRNVNKWNQQSYIKATNTEQFDSFGGFVKLSDNGEALAVRAIGEDSNATGVNGNQLNNDISGSGAVYLY